MSNSGQTRTPGQEFALFSTNIIMGAPFETTDRYTALTPVGMGVSGIVCSAKDKISNTTVAVKKLTEPFRTDNVAKHMYREVKLLKQLQHENIIYLKDVFISPSEDIYLVTDLMTTDLNTLLKTKKMDEQFTQYFMYQLMRGLKYVHSAGVVHRDLKPSNILINENCDLKICDFGLARVQETKMTGYVSTRYYRAPEIMLTWRRYNEKVDIWSAGCIFAEMILGYPIFPGKNHINQFMVITQILGSPPENVIANITSENTLTFLRSLPDKPRQSMSRIMPNAGVKVTTLLDKMLQIDPEERITAAHCLKSQYLEPYHDPDDEPVATEKYDWALLEADLPADMWKTVIYAEVLRYHEKGTGCGRSQLPTPPQSDEMDIS